MKSGCKQGCGLSVLMLAGLSLYLLLSRYNQPKPKPPEDFNRLAPAQKQQRRAATHELEAQVRDLATAAREKQHKPFALTITEDQLNTLLHDRVDTKKTPLRDVRAGLSRGGLTLHGRVLYKGFDATAALQGDIEVRNNQLDYKTKSLTVDGFPVSALKDRIDREITQALNRALKDAPGRITDTEIGDGEMTISGVTD